MTLPAGAGECPLARASARWHSVADHRELASDHWDGLRLQPERDCCRLSDAQARPGTAVTPRPGATRDFEQLRFRNGFVRPAE